MSKKEISDVTLDKIFNTVFIILFAAVIAGIVGGIAFLVYWIQL